MKPSFESVHAAENSSFLVRKFEEKKFSAPYHFHPEYELTLILQGRGKRYTGSAMNDFIPGDLVLLGANLPHCWKTEAAADAANSASIVIQFQQDFLGAAFLATPEMNSIEQLLVRSANGIQFTGNTDSFQQAMAAVLEEQQAFKKLALLLHLLHELAVTPHFILLHAQQAHASLSGPEQKRLHAVMAYIVDHFQHSVSLDKAAAVAHMTTPAFCKYFKRMTRKTFIQLVTDFRIDFARKQLLQTEKSIAQIGFDSGFNDISNFHKTFRQRTGNSPLEYRKQFLAREK